MTTTAPKPVSLFVAEGVALDSLTSRLTAFNMIDHVFIAALPGALIRLAAVSTYALGDEAGSFDERIRVLGPNGKELAVSMTHVDLVSRTPGNFPNSHRSIHVIWSIPLELPGDYAVSLSTRVGETSPWVDSLQHLVTVVVQSHVMLTAAATAARASVPPETPRAIADAPPERSR
jgi:hypothetical protein